MNYIWMKDSVPTILVCSVCSNLYLVLGFDILVLFMSCYSLMQNVSVLLFYWLPTSCRLSCVVTSSYCFQVFDIVFVTSEFSNAWPYVAWIFLLFWPVSCNIRVLIVFQVFDIVSKMHTNVRNHSGLIAVCFCHTGIACVRYLILIMPVDPDYMTSSDPK